MRFLPFKRTLSASLVDETQVRYPIFDTILLESRYIVICGGGGSSRTGILNKVEVFSEMNGKLCNLASYDTGNRTPLKIVQISSTAKRAKLMILTNKDMRRVELCFKGDIASFVVSEAPIEFENDVQVGRHAIFLPQHKRGAMGDRILFSVENDDADCEKYGLYMESAKTCLAETSSYVLGLSVNHHTISAIVQDAVKPLILTFENDLLLTKDGLVDNVSPAARPIDIDSEKTLIDIWISQNMFKYTKEGRPDRRYQLVKDAEKISYTRIDDDKFNIDENDEKLLNMYSVSSVCCPTPEDVLVLYRPKSVKNHAMSNILAHYQIQRDLDDVAVELLNIHKLSQKYLKINSIEDGYLLWSTEGHIQKFQFKDKILFGPSLIMTAKHMPFVRSIITNIQITKNTMYCTTAGGIIAQCDFE